MFRSKFLLFGSDLGLRTTVLRIFGGHTPVLYQTGAIQQRWKSEVEVGVDE